MWGDCQVRWELPLAAVGKHKCGAAGMRCGSVEEMSPSPAAPAAPCPARAEAAATVPHWDPAKADGAGAGETVQPVTAAGEGRFLSGQDGGRAAPPLSDGDAAALAGSDVLDRHLPLWMLLLIRACLSINPLFSDAVKGKCPRIF